MTFSGFNLTTFIQSKNTAIYYSKPPILLGLHVNLLPIAYINNDLFFNFHDALIYIASMTFWCFISLLYVMIISFNS
ncbi:hypothetical protein QVD17_05266 [Tagetes erecta]|uniref:Uncharacterized protein n=1 Tax=Tagetes erecta TaxID=13708 RepID=A0AAD8LH50_TARER|nr:hypothetical protein QVD17_05266 [Tagetes erecta]